MGLKKNKINAILNSFEVKVEVGVELVKRHARRTIEGRRVESKILVEKVTGADIQKKPKQVECSSKQTNVCSA